MEPKERILRKSHELFNRYGIRSVSMDDIAAQLGMSKKTVYQYYTDKDALVDAVFSEVMEGNKAQCLSCRDLGENAINEVFISFEMVKGMIAEMHPSVLYDLQKYHSATFKKFQDYRNHFLYKIIRQNMEQGIGEGLYRSDIDVDVLSRFRIHSIMMPFDSDIFPTNRTHLVHIEQELLDHFLYGVATPKGQKLIQRYINQRTKKAKNEEA